MISFRTAAASFVVITTLVSFPTCVGDGIGLNDFGDLIDTSATALVPLEPTLASIQANIFDQVCAVKCHRAPRPKKQMNLEPEEAYNNLVNVASEELPNMMRVVPGDSESSYIIWKLEGRTGIRYKQMPLNLPELPIEQIDAIRDWIDGGALE